MIDLSVNIRAVFIETAKKRWLGGQSCYSPEVDSV